VTFHGILNPAPLATESFTCNLTAGHPNFFSPGTGTAVAGSTVWTSCSVIGADVIGSFHVRDTTEISTTYQLPGLNYTIALRVTANNSTHQVVATGYATFKLVPKIQFSYTGAAPWYSSLIFMSTQTVYVHGWGFNGTSTGCTYSAQPGPGSIITAPTCSINAGELTSGQFTLAGGAGTTQNITATGNSGFLSDKAVASLSIVSGPAIQASPKWSSAGTTVTVTGIGFSSSDTSCVLSYLNLTFGQLYTGTSACTLTTVGTWKQPTVTFVVASTAGAGKNYTLRVMGFPANDLAYAYFYVNATAAIALNPATGAPGQKVLVTNSTPFSSLDAGLCTISSTPSGLISSYICIINPGGGLNTVTYFYVSSSSPGGAYVIRVTGIAGDYAETTFIATTARSVTLAPNSGSGGDAIQVNGLKFDLGDTACTIGTLNVTSPILSSSCSVSSGTVAGSFVIKTADTPAGFYNITVTGNTGDVGYAGLTVNPKIALTPNSARVGANVTLSGSNFAQTDANRNCVVSSNPAGAINFTAGFSPSCRIDSHYMLVQNGTFTSSFRVASNPSASSYTITVTGTGTAPPSTAPGSASATLTITSRAILLSPDHGPRGSWVIITGTGFSIEDTTCNITSTSGFLASSTCAISGGSIAGGFQVSSSGSLPLGSYVVNVTAHQSGTWRTATFLVTPSVSLTPASGNPGTAVSVLGSGFSAADTSCTITSSPSGLISSPVCALAGGAMSGSFTAASGATGAYEVIVTGSSGDAGSAWFNRITPTFELSPTSGAAGTFVTASGSDFLGTTCLITSVPAGLFTSSACIITAGTLSGSFTVASGASTGSYVVVVQTNAGALDSATVVFTVGLTTTITPTTTLTVPTTTTQTTALTTTTQTTSSITTSTSISSTTLSTTYSTTAPWTPPKPCIIATVSFGSEVSSAVQFLRSFRDGVVLSTKAGSAFMEVFNAWYYSFSPSVAGFIAGNDPLRAPVRVLLYPLLGILGVSSLAYSLLGAVPELAIVVAGLVASSLMGLVYLTVPAMFGVRALLKRRRIRLASLAKCSLALLAIALTSLTVGELTGSFLLLAVGGSAIVLTCLVAAPAVFALAMLRPNPE